MSFKMKFNILCCLFDHQEDWLYSRSVRFGWMGWGTGLWLPSLNVAKRKMFRASSLCQEDGLGLPRWQRESIVFMSSSLPAVLSFQFGASRPFLGMVPRKSLYCCPDQVSGSVNNRQQWGKGQDHYGNRNNQTRWTVPMPGALSLCSLPDLNSVLQGACFLSHSWELF